MSFLLLFFLLMLLGPAYHSLFSQINERNQKLDLIHHFDKALIVDYLRADRHDVSIRHEVYKENEPRHWLMRFERVYIVTHNEQKYKVKIKTEGTDIENYLDSDITLFMKIF